MAMEVCFGNGCFLEKGGDYQNGSMRGGWCSKEVGGSFGVGVLKCIRRGWDVFAAHVRYEAGGVSKVLFWHDVWCGELPLKTFFS
jgi:hypothetical protein